MRELKEFLKEKRERIKKQNCENNPYETIWTFPEIWNSSNIEILKNRTNWKIIFNLKLKQ